MNSVVVRFDTSFKILYALWFVKDLILIINSYGLATSYYLIATMGLPTRCFKLCLVACLLCLLFFAFPAHDSTCFFFIQNLANSICYQLFTTSLPIYRKECYCTICPHNRRSYPHFIFYCWFNIFTEVGDYMCRCMF